MTTSTVFWSDCCSSWHEQPLLWIEDCAGEKADSCVSLRIIHKWNEGCWIFFLIEFYPKKFKVGGKLGMVQLIAGKEVGNIKTSV